MYVINVFRCQASSQALGHIRVSGCITRSVCLISARCMLKVFTNIGRFFDLVAYKTRLYTSLPIMKIFQKIGLIYNRGFKVLGKSN